MSSLRSSFLADILRSKCLNDPSIVSSSYVLVEFGLQTEQDQKGSWLTSVSVAFSLELILEPVSEVVFQKLQFESALWIPDPESEGGRFEQIVERFLRKIITVPAQLTHLADEVPIEVMTDLDHLCACTEGEDEARVCLSANHSID